MAPADPDTEMSGYERNFFCTNEANKRLLLENLSHLSLPQNIRAEKEEGQRGKMKKIEG